MSDTNLEKDLYRIGEVSRLTETKAFVLRYWETEFPMLQPVKDPNGHRLYRREDVETVLRIKRLLYDEGFTIAGARRHLREADSGSPNAMTTSDEAAPGDLFAEIPADAPAPPPAESAPDATDAPVSGPRNAAADVDRKLLLDLRDSLRHFLTLLESE